MSFDTNIVWKNHINVGVVYRMLNLGFEGLQITFEALMNLFTPHMLLFRYAMIFMLTNAFLSCNGQILLPVSPGNLHATYCMYLHVCML